jgi:hypothetical protein
VKVSVHRGLRALSQARDADDGTAAP